MWKGKKVAVLGFGVEGVSSALYLAKKGAEVTVLDRKQESEFEKKMLHGGNISIVGGENYLEDLDKYDMIIRSPGIKLSTPQLQEAAKKNVIITSQTKLFFDLCPAKIIGVTGTKGKGTTSSLIYKMCKKQGFYAYLGGNIGKPPFEFLDSLSAQSIVVLELSSFQLQDLDKSPHIAVMLMVTSEHLNYHKDISEYVDAKRNIVRFQNANDFSIINRDYPASNESDVHTNAKILQISREREVVGEGCFVRDGKIIVRMARGPAAPFLPVSARSRLASSNELRAAGNPSSHVTPQDENFVSSPHIEDLVIIDTKDILLPGKHNLENVCAAVMAAVISGVSKEHIASVLKTFKGLEHRLELVANVAGVRYYDDSFSTTPETAIAAIQAFQDPEILIFGGSSKGSDFTEFGQIVDSASNIKAIIGVGEEWERIKEVIGNKLASRRSGQKAKNFIVIEGAKNMQQIVEAAAKVAVSGDVVLLSPACASFGMFKNYKDRGEQFKKEVNKLSFKS